MTVSRPLQPTSGADFVVDPRLPAQLASEMSDAEYENKVIGLLIRSFAADVEVRSETKDQWKILLARYRGWGRGIWPPRGPFSD